MKIAINFVFIALAFFAFIAGVFVFKRKALSIPLFALGFLLVALPFVRIHVLTRDAFQWKVIVIREVDATRDPKVVFVDRIEWITDYEKLKRRRGHVRSFLLKGDNTRREFDAKGYIPVSIYARILYGSDKITVTRSLKGLMPGSYTFTLTFNEYDGGSWTVVPNGS